MAVAAPQVVVKKDVVDVCKPRLDLVDKGAPEGIEVFQLKTQTDVPSSHLYMEAQIFTMAKRRAKRRPIIH